jgi:glutaconate CoA-transferase, subunit A
VTTRRWSLDEVAAAVPSGATIALGGSGMQRKPMGMLRAVVAAGITDLRVVSFVGAIDVEFLIASGAVSEIHTAGVALEGVGLAPAYRRARQDGAPRVVEWSEGSLHAALEAASRSLPSMPSTTSAASELVDTNPWLKIASDPFEGTPVVQVRALPVDVALLHVSGADDAGNLYIDGDPGLDGLLARCAGTVIASASATVPTEPRGADISRIWVDAVVDLPRGAWPTGCLPHERIDSGVVRAWARDQSVDALREGPA